LSRNTHRHDSVWVSTPPRIGAAPGPTRIGTISVRATFARRSGPYARYSIEVPVGVSIPPPIPCNARAAISSGRLSAAPHSADAAVNSASANRNVRLVPIRSPSHPDAGITTASVSR